MTRALTLKSALLAASLMLASSLCLADDQDAFPAPDKAVDALVSASRNNHTTELEKILGPGSDKLIFSGDDVADQKGRARFVDAYDKAHSLETESDGSMILVVGEEQWPMPMPLVHDAGGWRFDTPAGEQEISIAASGATSST